MPRLWFVLVFAPRLAAADLVLNEILYDPPGSDAGREFVEIVNSGAVAATLDAVVLEAGDGARPGTWRVVWQARPGALAPGAFLVVGGDSVATASERLAGDLQNGPDAVRLRRGDTVLDRVGYGELTSSELFERNPATDVTGVSLARVTDGEDHDDNAADFSAAAPSPGRRNVPRVDLALQIALPDPRRAWPGRLLVARVRLVNLGREPAEAFTLNAAVVPVFGEPWRDVVSFGGAQTLVTPALPATLAAGDSTFIDLGWTAFPGLARLEVQLHTGADEVASNDGVRSWVRVGTGEIVLNEIQFAPPAGAAEWIELWNRGAQPIHLDGWTLADASGRPATLGAMRALGPGAYAIAAADTHAVALDSAVVRVLVRPWPALNNSDGDDGFADDLVLRDAAGIVQDALRYRAADGVRGRSLERLTADADVRGLLWTASKDASGATPGRANSAAGLPRPRLDVQCTPNPFSPDGDGRDDALGVAVELPSGAIGWRLRVFDLEGRVRATLAADRLGAGPRRVVWDGRDARGLPLVQGVYILHLELLGTAAVRATSRHVVGLVRP